MSERKEIKRGKKKILKQVSGSQGFFFERELWYNEEYIPSLKPLILKDGIPLPPSSQYYPYWNTSLIDFFFAFLSAKYRNGTSRYK